VLHRTHGRVSDTFGELSGDRAVDLLVTAATKSKLRGKTGPVDDGLEDVPPIEFHRRVNGEQTRNNKQTRETVS
jgi:hypothetical protein